jgi:TRAP-type mannitol/chloroaromatic compound transport system substrate-binding protein
MFGLLTAFLFVTGLMFAPGAVAKEKVIKWKLQSHLPTASTSWAGAVLPVCKLLKERTNGRLIVEPFPAGSLVPAMEIFNALSRGMFQMGSGSGAYFGNKVPLAKIAYGLPFSFKKYNEVVYFHRVLGFDKMIRDACRKFGVYYSNLVIHPAELALRKEVRNFEDFKGLKLRSAGSSQRFLSACGAAASYLPGPEIYPSLASGVVDGAHWGGTQGANSMAFWDVAKFHMKPAVQLAGSTVWLASQKAIDKLPKDIQEIFYRTLDEHALEYTAAYEIKEDLVLAKAVKEKGVKVVWLTEDAQKKMTQVAMTIWDKEAARAPENAKAVQMIKDFLKDLGYI